MEKHILALQLSHLLGEQFSREWVYDKIEIPKQPHLGDLAFPCFSLASFFKRNPKEIASQLAPQLKHDLFAKVQTAGGYINIFLNQAFVTEQTMKQVLTDPSSYGSHSIGTDKTVVLDMSAPNIAKPFSMGHLRSTVIGSALSNLAKKCGYTTVKINYIGDYGTQFGKLLAAYQHWGNDEKVRENPLKELTKIYVHFHQASKDDPSLIEEGREWFKKLEQQDEEALKLWKWFKAVSLEEFDKVYELLGIEFDLTRGEAYYNDKMDKTVKLLQEKQLLEESKGAQVVRLDKEGLPPCLIQKSNGTSIYATRDLTAAIDRYQTYKFEEALYVVGHEQSLHFEQVKHVLRKLDFDWADQLKHISFGMVLTDGKKMSTRQGKTILLEEVLNEAIQQAASNIEEKNPELQNKEEIAKQVGVGAVIFHDLKHDRRNDIEFSLEAMLTFEGNTAPYLQYAYVRGRSLLEKGGFHIETADASLKEESAWPLVKWVRHYPEMVFKANTNHDPSIIAKYLLELTKAFNKYYADTKILQNDQQNARLTLIYVFTVVLKDGLSLLGIEAPEHM
ncbi:arginine--tRNA ligase [Halobacillus sp. B29]|uniref:arginine--tRNA ligase n=1 Tax=Halobacillus sp. B29 TaxID=3457432 RepID=UPI003FCE6F7D